MLYRAWRYGGGDWLLPWRMYHGLDDEYRRMGIDGDPQRYPWAVNRYRNLIYGFTKAAAVIEEGVPNKPVTLRPPRAREAPTLLGPDGRPVGAR
jgi:hypothetical protein